MLIVVTRKQPKCVYCVAAKSLLDRKEIPYEEVDVEGIRQAIVDLGIRTVPAIFSESMSKENFIGGYDDLKKYIQGL